MRDIRTQCDESDQIAAALWFWWTHANVVSDDELQSRLSMLLDLRPHEAPFEVRFGGIVSVTPEAYWNQSGVQLGRTFMARARLLAALWTETAWLRQA